MIENNEALFAAIDKSTPDVKRIRKSDLAFLRGVDLQHPYAENILKSVSATAIEVHRDNISADDVIYLRIALEIVVIEERDVLQPEPAVLWIGSDEMVELEGIKEIPAIEFDFYNIEELMERLHIEW